MSYNEGTNYQARQEDLRSRIKGAYDFVESAYADSYERKANELINMFKERQVECSGSDAIEGALIVCDEMICYLHFSVTEKNSWSQVKNILIKRRS